MSEAALDEFSAASTLPIVQAACAAVSLDCAEIKCLRMGENAIYQVGPAPVVVRIARSLQRLDDVGKEMRVARWLEQAGLPAARLAAENGPEPLIVLDRYPVTFWRYVRSAPPDLGQCDLGRLLRRLHELEPPEWVQLPAFTPFARVAERLDRAPAAADAADVAFLAELLADLQGQYERLRFEFPLGPVHGDAHLGNLMRDESGDVLLIDFEAFAFGHREWDLAVTGARRQGFAWLDDAEYRQFTDAYGFDILEWSGFPVFRAIRELTMTTWLMQLADDPRAAAEFHRRVDDIRHARFPRRWSPF